MIQTAFSFKLETRGMSNFDIFVKQSLAYKYAEISCPVEMTKTDDSAEYLHQAIEISSFVRVFAFDVLTDI